MCGKWHLLLIIALLCVIYPGASTLRSQETVKETSDTAAKESPEEIRKRLAEEKRKLEAIKQQRSSVNTEMQKLSAERSRLKKLLIDYAGRVQSSEAALSKLETRLKTLRRKEEIVRQSMQGRRETIGEMLGHLQRMGRNPPPILATHRDDALKMVRSAMLMSNMLPKLSEQAETLKSELQNLVSLKTKIAKQSERLRQQNAELESDRLRVKDLLEEKDRRLVGHNQELQHFEERAKEHSKSVASLGELITKVDLEMQRKTELGAYEQQLIVDAIQAKKQLGRKAAVELTPSEKKNNAFINPGRIMPALPFDKTKNTLSLPVRGTVLRGFGEKMKYDNTHKGLSIQTRSNAQITSPSDGWIAYAGKFRSYGQLLIINAGGGYHILLAGLDRIDVKTSQFVLAGEPIGAMETIDSNKKDTKKIKLPVLYIEFRKDGRPIDPNPWWSEEQQVSEK